MTQIELEPVQVPTRGTQAYEILMYLKRGGRLTVAKALTEFGVYALSQRVGELKKAGWPILTRMVDAPGGARIAEYRME
jgi:hypothetical protein